MQIKQKLTGKAMEGIVQTINVRATLRNMKVGASVFFNMDQVNENTLRHTCTTLKNEEGGFWSVDKSRIGYTVTRKA
jgi:hypothetical protein